MQLNIKNPEAYDSAAELANLTGESLTTAVTKAIRERLEREKLHREGRDRRIAALLEIGRRYSALPDAEVTDADEIIGYDENGLPR